MFALDVAAAANGGAGGSGQVLKYGDAAAGVVNTDGTTTKTFEYCLPLMTGFFNLDNYRCGVCLFDYISIILCVNKARRSYSNWRVACRSDVGEKVLLLFTHFLKYIPPCSCC